MNTTNPSIKEMLNPKKDESGTNPEINLSVQENQPLELEALRMHWRKYAFQLKEAGKTSAFSVMTSHDPKIINDHTVVFEVTNAWTEGIMKAELYELLAYLKVNLKNGNLQIHFPVSQEQKLSIAPHSPQEKFQLLLEKNPNLNMLQRMFNLDVEY